MFKKVFPQLPENYRYQKGIITYNTTTQRSATRNSFDQTPNEQHTQHFDIIFQPFEYLLNSSQRKNFKDFLNKLGEDDRKVDRKIFSVFAGKRLANKWQQMAPEVPFSPLAWEVLKALI